MSLEGGLPWVFILRWTFEQMRHEARFRSVQLDEAMEQISFTVLGPTGIERRYTLRIDRGWPRVDQVKGP